MKAQLWSLDLIVSVIVFLSLVTLFLFTFSTSSSDVAQQRELSRLQNSALEVTEALLRTPGIPTDWTNETVQVPGLAEQEGVLNITKILRFITISTANATVLLGIGGYNYTFRVEHLNGTLATYRGQNLTSGGNVSADSTIVAVKRYALLNNNIKRIIFTFWS